MNEFEIVRCVMLFVSLVCIAGAIQERKNKMRMASMIFFAIVSAAWPIRHFILIHTNWIV